MNTKRKRLSCTVVFMFASLVLLYGCGTKNADQAVDNSADNTEIQTISEQDEREPGISFPYELDEGKLLVNSVFQSDIENPDANNELGEDIVSIEFVNASDDFIECVDFEVSLEDGRVIPIHAEYIPSGAIVWAFASDNASAESLICTEISADIDYSEGPQIDDANLEVTTEDTTVTIRNVGPESMKELTVFCHCNMGDVLFGGKAYAYPLEDISAGEATVIEADECYLGIAQVVCIE